MTNKHIIGFSSGLFWHNRDKPTKENINLCKNMDCKTIELHCDLKNLNLLDQLNKKDFDGFEFVSYHLSNLDITKNELKIWLDRIEKAHHKINFGAVVVHPDRIDNWGILKQYNLPFSVENMDSRKKIGKTLESMKKIISQNDYKATLDVNHCYINDNTLKLADDLWNEFEDRISHFHLSGVNENWHGPLSETKQTQLIDFVRDKARPIIIECIFDKEKEVKKEFDYITKHLHA